MYAKRSQMALDLVIFSSSHNRLLLERSTIHQTLSKKMKLPVSLMQSSRQKSLNAPHRTNSVPLVLIQISLLSFGPRAAPL